MRGKERGEATGEGVGGGRFVGAGWNMVEQMGGAFWTTVQFQGRI